MFREIVVVRGDERDGAARPDPAAAAGRPDGAPAEAGMDEASSHEASDLKPFERGPEITEIH